MNLCPYKIRIARYSILSLLLLSYRTILRANQVDTTRLRHEFHVAVSFNEQKDLQRASRAATTLLQQLEKMEEPVVDLKIGAYNILGDCALESGQYQKALENYHHSEAIIQNKGLDHSLLNAEVLHKLGNYHRETKDFSIARNYLVRALNIRKLLLGEWNLEVADTYINLGHCLNYIGDFEKALEFHRQALAIRLDLSPNNQSKIAQCYNNIGLSLGDHQKYEEALQAYQKALDYYIAYHGREQHPDVADVFLNLGNTYGDLGQLETFIRYQQKALAIWLKAYGGNHPSIALAYNNLANAYYELEDDRKAFELFQKALAMRIDLYGAIHPDVAQVHFNIGLCFLSMQDWTEAMNAFEKCQSALHYQPAQKAGFKEVNDPVLLLHLLNTMPTIPINRYQDGQNLSHLLQASSYLEQADQLIDFLRINYRGTDSKLILASTASGIYDLAIEISLFLALQTKDEQYRKQAFQFSEKSKGLLLLEALQKTDAESFAGIPPDLIRSIKQLENKIAALEKEKHLRLQKGLVEEASDSDGIDNLLFQNKQQLTGLISSLEADYPQYYNLRYATSIIPINWLQTKILDKDQTIVEYFVGSNYLHIFVVNQNEFESKSIQIPSDLFSTLKAFDSSARGYPFVSSRNFAKLLEQYTQTGHRLYQYLIDPIKEHLREEVIIIPDGVLGFLSFDMILSSVPTNLFSLRDYPFLLRDHTISYNYSTRLYQEMKDRKSVKGLKPYIGFAPEFGKTNTMGLAKLKYSLQEVDVALQTMKGQVLKHKEATKANFLELQKQYSVLHLATHGKANTTFADYSFLAFSETEQTKGDDALLYVREIYNLATNADLVVLSACETGTGELLEGEGIASIARSFSYAGAGSLIASHWSVDDEATSKLMQLFFKNIRRGFAKDRALQQAKLEFLQRGDPQHAHPFYWAAFIPIGNMDQIAGWSALRLLDYPICIGLLLLIIALLFAGLLYLSR